MIKQGGIFMKRNFITIAALLLLSLFFTGCGSAKTSETSATESTTSEAPTSEVATSEDTTSGKPKVEIAVKDYGTITVELEPDAAPISVQNFIDLAKEGFYDGLTFHRIIEGFMIQGGDPDGNGTGGSDKTIKGEFSENGVDNSLSHTRGAISMARSMEYDSASSQFFIVQEDSTTFLDGKYAAFGYVTGGMEIVDQICKDTVVQDGDGTVNAADQPVITSIKVVE